MIGCGSAAAVKGMGLTAPATGGSAMLLYAAGSPLRAVGPILIRRINVITSAPP